MTICHSRTRDLASVVRDAEIVVAAVGRPCLVRPDWIRPAAVVIDGCDIGATTTSTSYLVYVNGSGTSPLDVSIRNSYLHGGNYGVYFGGTTNAQAKLSLVNNTIDKAQNGIYLAAAPTAAVNYTNNIISNSTAVGVNVTVGMTAVTHSNNALFGNVTNYSGAAVEGAAYVKTDCQLDMATGIPQTKAGSPCRGVGKPDGAPPTDYWNASRGTKIDLGAVQGP